MKLSNQVWKSPIGQLVCALPKTNTTFHQLFKYVKKEAIVSSIRGENSRNIFGPCSMRGTVNVMHSDAL